MVFVGMVLALLLHGNTLVGVLILPAMTFAAAVTASRRAQGIKDAPLLCFYAIAAGAGVVEQKGIGPELSQMAGMHPPEFFAESIINPNAVIDADAKKLGYVAEDGKSRMPDYNNVLTIKQVADLASYIASLKGQTSNKHSGH